MNFRYISAYIDLEDIPFIDGFDYQSEVRLKIMSAILAILKDANPKYNFISLILT